VVSGAGCGFCLRQPCTWRSVALGLPERGRAQREVPPIHAAHSGCLPQGRNRPELVRVRPPEAAQPVDGVGAVVQHRASGDVGAVRQDVGLDRKLGVLGEAGSSGGGRGREESPACGPPLQTRLALQRGNDHSHNRASLGRMYRYAQARRLQRREARAGIDASATHAPQARLLWSGRPG
jgi:hypothetical protein